MSDLTNLILAFAVAGLTIAVGIWLLVRGQVGANNADSEPLGQLSDMGILDWINTALNLVLGVLLGNVIAGLVQLVATGFWVLAILMPVLFAGLLLFGGLIDGLVDRVFPSGIRPARKPKARRRLPLLRRLSLPVGIVVGVALAQVGLGDRLLTIFF